MTGHAPTAVCRTLKVSRSSAYRPSRERPRFYRRAEDAEVLERVRDITRRRDSDGHRRVYARVNRRLKKGACGED